MSEFRFHRVDQPLNFEKNTKNVLQSCRISNSNRQFSKMIVEITFTFIQAGFGRTQGKFTIFSEKSIFTNTLNWLFL
jgi:hypothetical protein